MKKTIVAVSLAIGVALASDSDALAWRNKTRVGGETGPLWGLWQAGSPPKPEALGGILSGAGAAPVAEDAPKPIREQGPLFPFATPPHINLTAPAPIQVQ